MTEEITMTMKSNDGQSFEVPLNVAQMFEALCPDEVDENDTDIDCLRISGELLEKIIGFCKNHQADPMEKIVVEPQHTKLEEIVTQEQYLTFIKGFDKDELFQLIQAANYANIKPLMYLSVLALCVEINNKSEEEIREIFKIPKPVSNDGAEKSED